jgi:hypothetical protein
LRVQPGADPGLRGRVGLRLVRPQGADRVQLVDLAHGRPSVVVVASAARTCVRARCSRERTVPTGTPSAAAISS